MFNYSAGIGFSLDTNSTLSHQMWVVGRCNGMLSTMSLLEELIKEVSFEKKYHICTWEVQADRQNILELVYKTA